MENKKIYEFTGKIKGKEVKKVYRKGSKYEGNIYHRLQVELENNHKLKEILIFQDSKVWQEVQEADYNSKRYLFFCSPKVSNYRIVAYQLVDWKELTNHGSN